MSAEPRAYYNEHDKYAAAWLRNLISAGHIAPGDVDERDIRDVRPADLRGYRQCHFFAGVGVWSYSLRRAGWPDRRHVWTASCPCQPFSAAGKGGGLDDERHLWPAFFHLVEQCGPGELFGEQVASKDGLAWLDLVHADMEGAGYAFGALDICAAGFGAPHIRQRLYWTANAPSIGRQQVDTLDDFGFSGSSAQRWAAGSAMRSSASVLADDDVNGHEGRTVETLFGTGRREERNALGRSSASLAEQHSELADASDRQFSEPWRGAQRRDGHRPDRQNAPTGPVNGIWRDADWLLCRDGKWRPVRSGTFPLAHGAPARVGFVCAACAQASAQDENDEDVRALRETLSADGGRLASEILQSNVHGERLHEDTADERSGALPSAEYVSGEAVRALRQDGAIPSPAPQGREPDEQHVVEHHDPVRGLPLERAQENACDCCGNASDWLIAARISGNRVGRLRAYGNAIVSPQAEEFIGAYLDAEAEQHLRLTGGIFA